MTALEFITRPNNKTLSGFEQLRKEGYESLVWLAKTIVSRETDAQEIVLDAFTDFYELLLTGEFEFKAKPYSYLYGNVKRAALNSKRDCKTVALFADNETENIEAMNNILDTSSNQVIIRSMYLEYFQKEVYPTLTNRELSVFKCMLNGVCEAEEIAEITNRTVNAIYEIKKHINKKVNMFKYMDKAVKTKQKEDKESKENRKDAFAYDLKMHKKYAHTVKL